MRDNEYQVVLGGVNIDKAEEFDQTIPVIQTIVHENYRETRAAVYNDIGRLSHSSNTVSSVSTCSISNPELFIFNVVCVCVCAYMHMLHLSTQLC